MVSGGLLPLLEGEAGLNATWVGRISIRDLWSPGLLSARQLARSRLSSMLVLRFFPFLLVCPCWCPRTKSLLVTYADGVAG
jgi:hypothetical protein